MAYRAKREFSNVYGVFVSGDAVKVPDQDAAALLVADLIETVPEAPAAAPAEPVYDPDAEDGA